MPTTETQTNLSQLAINTIRTLSMDAVQAANSGHPGTPMALAPLAYVLFTRHMRYNPQNPEWVGRDRFILSAGHASMLQYAMLYLTGYDVSLEDIKNFRQLHSKTPGHPEYGYTAGVETTTGPLGQGVMSAAGMAMAEAHLGAVFNKGDHSLFDHYTYVICSDGDLMEGCSHEAASLAGHLGLGKLIYIYDDNHITIEGGTDIAFSDDTKKRFEGYNWHVVDLGDKANDLDAMDSAIAEAKANTDQPSIIILRSHIGYGSPLVDTAKAHGSPLGAENIKITKEYYGWPTDKPFHVPQEALDHMREAVTRGAQAESDWNNMLSDWKAAYPELASLYDAYMEQPIPANLDELLPTYEPGTKTATRNVNSDVINAVAADIPWLIGGSADLAGSTKTMIKNSEYLQKDHLQGRNIGWGVREMGMAAAATGMALHGGIRPYCATFFVFTDYARGAIRLSALMKQPVIYLMTHDSIGLGEDGPTHQPIEHLASLRAMPDLTVLRPGDPNEAVASWKYALEHNDGPVMLVLTRQGLEAVDRSVYGSTDGVAKGAYVLAKEKGDTPQVILMATGSEVEIALEAYHTLQAEGVDARVVSMPSWELFQAQDEAYRSAVLPSNVKARVSVEAASTFGWHRYVGDSGIAIGVDSFGLSAPYKESYAELGITTEAVVAAAKKQLA